MAIHSSTIAWKIPWTKEPGRLQSMGSQRVGHNCLTNTIKMRTVPGGSDGKASVYNVGDLGSIPGSGSSLEKEMAIHSSTIAWKIPWTEEPGRLQSMGSQRVRRD